MNQSHYWLLPTIIIIFATLLGFIGKSIISVVKKVLTRLDKFGETLVEHKLQTQRLADQITGIDGKTRDNEKAIAQLIVSTTTLNTVVAEHVKWSDKRDTYLTRELGKKAPKPGRGE